VKTLQFFVIPKRVEERRRLIERSAWLEKRLAELKGQHADLTGLRGSQRWLRAGAPVHERRMARLELREAQARLNWLKWITDERIFDGFVSDYELGAYDVL
jgi:hypothetical protein